MTEEVPGIYACQIQVTLGECIFKFRINDTDWLISRDYEMANDGKGNINNRMIIRENRFVHQNLVS